MNRIKRPFFLLFFVLAMTWLAVTYAFAQALGTVPDQATWLAVLQMLGMSQYAASIIAVVGLFGFILVHVMPYVTAPSADAPSWWRMAYAVLTFLAGNYFNAKNAGTSTVPPATAIPTIVVALLAVGLALQACGVGATALTAAGVAPAKAQTIAVDTADAGQLFCKAGPMLMAVSGVNVINAAAPAVADACAKATAVGALTPPATPPVPVAGPAGAVAVLATVAPAIAEAVLDSIGS
jgi:hypothetical protein